MRAHGVGGRATARAGRVGTVGLVRNAALQNGWTALSDPSERGKLRENAVAAHLHAVALRRRIRLYHWREGRQEVDFVLDHPGEPLAIEVASSPGHSRAGLLALARRHPQVGGRSWLTWPDAPLVLPDSAPDGIGTLDLSVLLQILGLDADSVLLEA